MRQRNKKILVGIKRMLRCAANVVYPARCPVCNEIIPLESYICEKCSDKFKYKNCKTHIGKWVLYYVSEYNETAKSIVLGAKNDWDGDKLDFMAKSIYDMLSQYNVTKNIDGIVPVPLSFKSRLERGYNQTEKIAEKLEELGSLKIIRAVKKQKNTAQQKMLSRSERQKNLKNAFSLNDNCDIYGTRLLVVDDVCTTGATMNEVASLLIAAGCESVTCVCFARATY